MVFFLIDVSCGAATKAFIAENSPSHESWDFVLIKEGVQAGGLGYLKQAPDSFKY